MGNDTACGPVALRATRSGLPIAGADFVPLEKRAASLRRSTRFLLFPRKKYVANFFALVGWIAVTNPDAPENRERWQNGQALIAAQLLRRMKERLARTVWFAIEQLKIYALKITKYLYPADHQNGS